MTVSRFVVNSLSEAAAAGKSPLAAFEGLVIFI